MTTEATEEGASVHEILLNKMQPAEVQAEVTTEETETETTESDDQTEVETESSEESEVETQEVSEQPEAETLELPEIATYLGYDHEKLDVTDAGELVFKTKIDGEEGQATLTDLVKSYQLEGHLNKQNMEVTELQKTLKGKIEATETQLGERLQEVEDLATIVYQELLKEYDTVDWAELRAEDAGEYSARQTDFQNRKNNIAQQYQQIQDKKQETTTANSTATNEKLLNEQAKLVAAMNWSNDEQSQKEFLELSSYAVSTGFTQAEFNSIPDHRYLVALSKAAKYDALQKESPRITNKVKKAPKLVKPGTAKVKETNANKVSELKSNIKKLDGKQGSVAKWLLESGKV